MGYVWINEKLLKDLMVFVSGSRLECIFRSSEKQFDLDIWDKLSA